jgi:hypothetical protein
MRPQTLPEDVLSVSKVPQGGRTRSTGPRKAAIYDDNLVARATGYEVRCLARCPVIPIGLDCDGGSRARGLPLAS